MTVKRDNQVGGPLGVEPGAESVELDDAGDHPALAVRDAPTLTELQYARDVRVGGRGRRERRARARRLVGRWLCRARRQARASRWAAGGRQHLAGPCPLHDRALPVPGPRRLPRRARGAAAPWSGRCSTPSARATPASVGDLLHRCGGVSLSRRTARAPVAQHRGAAVAQARSARLTAGLLTDGCMRSILASDITSGPLAWSHGAGS